MTIELICRQLGLEPTAGQLQSLEQHLALLQRWNTTYNLTSVRDPAAMLVQHLADCLSVIPPLQRRLTSGALLDVGSGGGLPGIPIAIMLPAVAVTCVDAVAKKAAFVRQAAGLLNLGNLQAVHDRVEQLPGQFDVITSRAFASLSSFCRMTIKNLHPDAAWMAMKGKTPTAEMAALPPTIQVFHVEPLQVPGLDVERCAVWLRPALPSCKENGAP